MPLLQNHPSTHLSVTSHLYESQSHFLHLVAAQIAVAAVHFVLLVAVAAAHFVLLVAVAAVEHFQLS